MQQFYSSRLTIPCIDQLPHSQFHCQCSTKQIYASYACNTTCPFDNKKTTNKHLPPHHIRSPAPAEVPGHSRPIPEMSTTPICFSTCTKTPLAYKKIHHSMITITQHWTTTSLHKSVFIYYLHRRACTHPAIKRLDAFLSPFNVHPSRFAIRSIATNITLAEIIQQVQPIIWLRLRTKSLLCHNYTCTYTCTWERYDYSE